MIKKIFNRDVENYYLLGDSSGGNYVVAICYWLIESQLKQPKSISLCYPVIHLRRFQFSPSILICLDDLLMSYGIKDIMVQMYLDDFDLANQDPYVSPLMIDDRVLNKFPKTFVYCGTWDPLYDDNVRFVCKLLELERKALIYSYSYLRHGMLGKSASKWPPSILFFENVLFNLKKEIR